MEAHMKLSKSTQGDWLVLLGPYDPGVIRELKQAVPQSDREWRPVAKCWRIRPEHEQAVREIVGVS